MSKADVVVLSILCLCLGVLGGVAMVVMTMEHRCDPGLSTYYADCTKMHPDKSLASSDCNRSAKEMFCYLRTKRGGQ